MGGGQGWQGVGLWAVLLAGVAMAQPSSLGQWGPVQSWPMVAVHAHLLPTGKVFFFSEFDLGADPPYLWDPATDTLEKLPAPPYNLFCAGHVFFPDGRLFLMGGHISLNHGFRYTSVFDPYTKRFTRAPDMNAGRWYPTGTVLHNGDVLVMSGNDERGVSNTTPQVFELSNQRWRTLAGAAGIYAGYYPMNFALPNGKVLMVGPSPTARWLDPNGAGAWTADQLTSYGAGRSYGTAVQYLPGKILLIGGGIPPTNHVEVIDANQPSSRFRPIQPLSHRRRQAVASIMPDGKVLVVGGHYGSTLDSPTMGIYEPELWDPDTETWTPMAPHSAYRGYHSTALLLPDGRVLSAGSTHMRTMQVYSPPYLFKGERPTLVDAPDTIGYDQRFGLKTSQADSIAQVTLVRLPSVTHAFDENQRFNSLAFQVRREGLIVTSPPSDFEAPPGHYMLFVVNKSGVPSVAKVVQLSNSGGSPVLPPETGSRSDSAEADGGTLDNGSPALGPAQTCSTTGMGFPWGALVGWLVCAPLRKRHTPSAGN